MEIKSSVYTLVWPGIECRAYADLHDGRWWIRQRKQRALWKELSNHSSSWTTETPLGLWGRSGAKSLPAVRYQDHGLSCQALNEVTVRQHVEKRTTSAPSAKQRHRRSGHSAKVLPSSSLFVPQITSPWKPLSHHFVVRLVSEPTIIWVGGLSSSKKGTTNFQKLVATTSRLRLFASCSRCFWSKN